MTSLTTVQQHHLDRKAVIYIRQSSGHQVLSNLESGKMQLAMQEHAKRLGWQQARIEIVEADTGTSAQSTAGRDGYRRLLSDLALGSVGIVISYESTRISRNCSDWYPLLDLCAIRDCLIGDRDGVYDPGTINGRMLLGMKGILSEVELHTLRGRLTAGIRNKADRGELALQLPAGLERSDGRVLRDPNVQVSEVIALVFRTFLELRSASRVVKYFRDHELRLPRRHPGGGIIWRKPSVSAVLSVLKHPVYAGAYTYGRTATVREPGGRRPTKPRAIEDWPVLLRDHHPAYISWDTYEQIQKIIADNYAEYRQRRSRGAPREGDALLQGIVYCGECGHKMTVQYKGGARYLCQFQAFATAEPTCQRLPAGPIDTRVVDAFLEVLAPAELDIYEQAVQSGRDANVEVERAQQRELQRLRYEVELARRQYDRVDPDNRLVASSLESRWEAALAALAEAEARFAERSREKAKVVPLTISRDLRSAFQSLGRSLPELWAKDLLKRPQRKALLRCLIEKVVVARHRETRQTVHTRVVWRGGAVSEFEIPIAVESLAALPNHQELREAVLTLEADGTDDIEIARLLTDRRFRSPQQTDRVLPSTVAAIRREGGRLHRYHGPRPRQVDGYLTLPQLAARLGVKPHRIYELIRRGVVDIERDAATRLYLFPDTPEALEDFRRFERGEIDRVSSRRGHRDA